MAMIDRAWSQRVAQQIDAFPKACYTNARRALVRLPALRRAWYCEGIGIVPLPGGAGLFPTEHAWLEMDSPLGVIIIDPTWADIDGAHYVAAYRWSRVEIQTVRGDVSEVERRRLWGDPAWQDAWKEASRLAQLDAQIDGETV